MVVLSVEVKEEEVVVWVVLVAVPVVAAAEAAAFVLLSPALLCRCGSGNLRWFALAPALNRSVSCCRYIINAPWWFNTVYKVVALLLDPATREKVSVYGAGPKGLEKMRECSEAGTGWPRHWGHGRQI